MASESSDRQLGFDFVLKYTKKYPSTSVFKLHTFFYHDRLVVN